MPIMCAFCGEREAVALLPLGPHRLIAQCAHCEALPEDAPAEQSGLVAAAIIAHAVMGASEVN